MAGRARRPITIPTIGSTITLTRDWTFGLYPEHRNATLWNVTVGPLEKRSYFWTDWARCRNDIFTPVTLPAGTVLKVDRIYLRKGSEDFDSVSFRTVECPSNPKLAKKRFWAKLRHVNLIEGEWDESTVPRAAEPVVMPEEVEVPVVEWGWVIRQMPADLHDVLLTHIREGEQKTRDLHVHFRRGIVHVTEVIGGQTVELWSESREEPE